MFYNEFLKLNFNLFRRPLFRRLFCGATIFIGIFCLEGSTAGGAVDADWKAEGTLFEACSCSVPCPCNFGQSPSHEYCHTIYAYRLRKAHYGRVSLDGLAFGGGEGEQGAFGFIDGRATAAQREALKQLAAVVFAKGGPSPSERPFLSTSILTRREARTFGISFGESGGFQADFLIGADGKSPIIVENNVTWPVKRFQKGKTTLFDYHDPRGNRLHFDGVNANLGDFILSGEVKKKGRDRIKTGFGGCLRKVRS